MSPPSAGTVRATAAGTGIDDGSGVASDECGAGRSEGSGFVEAPPGRGLAALAPGGRAAAPIVAPAPTALACRRAAADRATAWLPAERCIASTPAIRWSRGAVGGTGPPGSSARSPLASAVCALVTRALPVACGSL